MNIKEVKTMNDLSDERLGSFMCLLLRHNPKKYNLKMDEFGNTDILSLLDKIHSKPKWKTVTLDDIQKIVDNDNKKRYEISKQLIRARYGHSFPVQHDNKKGTLPAYLYHGTNVNALSLILNSQIETMKRDKVHLSETTHFATLAGKRKGQLVLLKIDTKLAVASGTEFVYADDEVWLSTPIPASCISEIIK